jgi:hypothetical protein
MQDLCNAIEAAIKARIEAENIDINIYTGQGSDEKETPCLVIHAQSGSESPLGSGNFTISVNCEIRYPADTEELTAHRTLASAALGELMRTDLATNLSSEATGLTVFGILNRQVFSGIDENHWLTTLSFDLYCCVLDIA